MSSPAPSADPVVTAPPVETPGEAPAPWRRRRVPPTASAYWRGWPEVRADLRSSAGIVLALALAGIPAGLLWFWLAPRADFEVTDAGPVPVGSPSEELLVADDAVYALVLLGIGLLAGAAAWFLRRRRGVATVLALAVGGCLTAVVAWQLGELLGPGPTEQELADVGTRVTTSLSLSSGAAMALAPFGALLSYVAAVLYAPHDDLGRLPAPAPPTAVLAGSGEPPLS